MNENMAALRSSVVTESKEEKEEEEEKEKDEEEEGESELQTRRGRDNGWNNGCGHWLKDAEERQ